MRTHLIYIVCSCVALLTACTPEARIPENAALCNEPLEIYPDYRDITIPANIAPLNIMAKAPNCNEFVAAIKGKGNDVILAAAGKDGKLMFEESEWHNMLNTNRGCDISVTLYSKTKDSGLWQQHPDYKLSVADEDIDAYLSYRLIEPSYELYRQLGLYQRDLTTFREDVIYENNDNFEAENNHCINCHNYQNYSTKNMLFHIRGEHGGTIFVRDGKADKRIMVNDSILGNAVYPSWHPTKPWLVFSSNQTGQAFYLRDAQKIEVVDYGSDLIFYDAENNTISNVLKTPTTMENFPCWAPDGKTVYYCSCNLPGLDTLAVSDKDRRSDVVLRDFNKVRYNLMSISFDESTQTWGTPQTEYDCVADSMSATVPRVSPNGRYLLFTLGEFGQFHIWHKSSDLYVKDLQTQEVRPLKMANSNHVDSYHSWSSNGRWIVFSSRRDDGNYTRPYIAYFDKNGKDHKAFLLPQKDPEYNILRMKSYNVPELTKDAVRSNTKDLQHVVCDDDNVARVSYK